MNTVAGYPVRHALSKVADFRKPRGKHRPLVAILALGCVATLCGASSLTAISQLNQQESAALRQLYRQTKDADLRSRCQMILLSADGHGVAGIARRTLFDENSVLSWFDRYEAEGLPGLEDGS